MSLLTSNLNNNEKRRWLFAMIALLLVGAQLLTQLHSLEHIEQHDNDQHSEINCDICILSADLENSSPASNTFPSIVFTAGKQLFFKLDAHQATSLTFAFSPRAPPVLLQLI